MVKEQGNRPASQQGVIGIRLLSFWAIATEHSHVLDGDDSSL